MRYLFRFLNITVLKKSRRYPEESFWLMRRCSWNYKRRSGSDRHFLFRFAEFWTCSLTFLQIFKEKKKALGLHGLKCDWISISNLWLKKKKKQAITGVSFGLRVHYAAVVESPAEVWMMWARRRRNSFVCLEEVNISWTVADTHMTHRWFCWIMMTEKWLVFSSTLIQFHFL